MPRRYIIEEIKTIGDYKYVVIFGEIGHRCGYVAIKPSHPLFGFDYDADIKSPELLQEIKSSTIGKKSIIDVMCWDGESTKLAILIDVHGGLTYSALGHLTSYPTIQFDKVWWLGFDCGHYGDAKDLSAMQKHFPSYYNLMQEHNLLTSFFDNTVKPKQYVINECLSMIQQLDCIKDTLKETRVLIAN